MEKRDNYAKGVGLIIGAFAVIGFIFLIYYMGKESTTYRSSYSGYNVDDAVHLKVPQTGRIRLATAHLYGDEPVSEQQTGIIESHILKRLRGRLAPHPTIEHQKRASSFTHPAHIGDAIRPGNPIRIGPINKDYIMHKVGGDGRLKLAYNTREGYGDGEKDYPSPPMRGGGPPLIGAGPYPGKPLNVPVPRGSLKMTSEKYKFPFYYNSRPLHPYDYFRPYGPNQESMQNEVNYVDTPFYSRSGYSLIDTGSTDIPFIGSVSSYAPFPEVYTPWEKVGIVTSKEDSHRSDGEKTIMQLYRRAIAPLQDLFKYSVQDKNGFIIPLNVNFIEDGDLIDNIIGKGGPWKANIFVGDKYVWV